MKFSIILLGAALYFISSTEAAIKAGKPFTGITWNGGETEEILWDDDGKAPALKEIGLTTVDLMAGGDVNQVRAGTIGKLLATTEKITYTVPKDIGPAGDFYFIKFTAGEYTSFSGIFSIQNVNGTIQGFDPKAPNTKAPDAPVPKAAPSSPSAPGYPSSPSPSSAPSPKADPKTGKANPAESSPSTPTPLSASDSSNLLPSFIGVTTAAVAFALTYLC